MRQWKLVLLAVLLAFTGSACSGNAKRAELTMQLISTGDAFLLDLKYEQALVSFLQVIDVEPKNPRGYTGAAEAYLAIGKSEEALAVLQQGLTIITDDPILQAMLADIEERLIPLEPSPEPTDEPTPTSIELSTETTAPTLTPTSKATEVPTEIPTEPSPETPAPFAPSVSNTPPTNDATITTTDGLAPIPALPSITTETPQPIQNPVPEPTIVFEDENEDEYEYVETEIEIPVVR